MRVALEAELKEVETELERLVVRRFELREALGLSPAPRQALGTKANTAKLVEFPKIPPKRRYPRRRARVCQREGKHRGSIRQNPGTRSRALRPSGYAPSASSGYHPHPPGRR